MEYGNNAYARTGASFIRSYFKIMRIEIFGREMETALLARRKDVLYAGWHCSFSHITTVTAGEQEFPLSDGELIALVCRHLGITGFRGSSTRGGSEALHG